MSTFASRALEFIKDNVSDNSQYVLPTIPSVAIGSVASYGNYGIDFLNTGISAGINEYLRIEQDLISRYVDYENMDDNSPIIGSGFDIYADDATQYDTLTGQTVWIECEDEDVRKELNTVFQKRIMIEERIWEMTRVLCKYGNQFNELVVKDGEGLVAMNLIPPPVCRRIDVPGAPDHSPYTGFIYDPTGLFRINTRDFSEKLSQRTQDGVNAGYTFTQSSPDTLVYEDWEVVHMRLTGKKPGSQYGFGIADGVRWLYKRLEMLEDSVVLHRLTRSPSRYAVYVDVSNINPNEVNGYLNNVKQAMSKQKYVNPATGKMDQRFDVHSVLDNFYLPVRDGRESTRIESLAGPVYDYIEDIKFFEDKLFAGLKIPRAFLSYEESTAKTNLSAEDSRFARTIMRIQREIRNGLKKAGRVHLAAKGIRPDFAEFDVKMTIPSAIFELAQMEIRNAELELADKFEAYAPREWVMKNILGFSDDQIYEMEEMRRREEEAHAGGLTAATVARGMSAADGSIERALASRGSPSAPDRGGPPVALTAGESKGWMGRRRSKISSDEYLFGGKKANIKSLTEKIDDLRKRDKDFAKKWDRIEGLLTDLRHNLKSSK